MENKNISKVKRGEIYLYDFGTNEGSIQNGLRPALVVQCDEGNKASCTTVIAAMTTVRLGSENRRRYSRQSAVHGLHRELYDHHGQLQGSQDRV